MPAPGATVGKMLGATRAMKGGVGTAALSVDGLIVGVLVAVNANGTVIDPRTSATDCRRPHRRWPIAGGSVRARAPRCRARGPGA